MGRSAGPDRGPMNRCFVRRPAVRPRRRRHILERRQPLAQCRQSGLATFWWRAPSAKCNFPDVAVESPAENRCTATTASLLWCPPHGQADIYSGLSILKRPLLLSLHSSENNSCKHISHHTLQTIPARFSSNLQPWLTPGTIDILHQYPGSSDFTT